MKFFAQYLILGTESCHTFMLKISYLGHSAFKIKSSGTSLITDPFDPKVTGISWRKQEADIVTISHDHQDHNCLEKIEGVPFVVKEPGEYEIKGVHIFGESSFHDKKKGSEHGENIIFSFHWDDFVIVHLGDLGDNLSSNQVEDWGQIDVLMVPVGGTWTINSEEASELIAQLEPSFVIPMHYKTADSKIELDSVDVFLEQMGVPGLTPQSSLDLKSRSSLPEQTQVVLLDYK